MGMLSTLHDIELLNRGVGATDLSYGENLLNGSAALELAGWPVLSLVLVGTRLYGEKGY